MKLEKFDYQIKDNKKNKSVVILGITVVALLAGFIIYKSFAAYKVTETYNIIKGSVAEFTQEKLKIAYNLVGEDGGIMTTSEIPSSKEYEYDAASSSCVNGNTIVYDKTSNTITIGDNAEGLKDTCNIYFNYIPLAKQTLYALGYTADDIKTGIPYGPEGTNVTGFYESEDDYGTSYYYYNNGDNCSPEFVINGWIYLLFRINGNGSLRMFSYDFNVSSAFNKSDNDNAYLGFMFADLGASEILNKNNSHAKSVLNTYYEDVDMTYFDDAIFCNDRSLYKEEYGAKEQDDTASGLGTNITYYGAYYRIRNNTPTLKCPNKNDAFTVDDEEMGNGMLEYPVGLMTADEAYMTNAKWYYDWYVEDIVTMSPAMFKDNTAYIYHVGYEGIEKHKVTDDWSLKQVINIKAGTKFTGTGLADSPFEIVQ